MAAIPLYLLKIEMIPREAAWLPSLVFVIFLAPARLLTGWAYARSGRRDRPRHWVFRVLGRIAIIPAALLYVLVVFLRAVHLVGRRQQPRTSNTPSCFPCRSSTCDPSSARIRSRRPLDRIASTSYAGPSEPCGNLIVSLVRTYATDVQQSESMFTSGAV